MVTRAVCCWLLLISIWVHGASAVFGDYAEEVLADSPIAYWRLADAQGEPALNEGTLLSAVDGLYSGGFFHEEDGLLFDDENLGVIFDGIDGEVQIPDNPSINAGGPFTSKTVELWFLADIIDASPRILYEQGGTTRGMNLFVQEVDGAQRLFATAWNRAEQFWGPIVLSTSVSTDKPYHVAFVFDASSNDAFGDFDGRLTLYVDGAEVASAMGADRLYNHGDDIAIGGVHVNTLFPDLSNPGDGANFSGIIDEVALYNIALDDPNDDGDRSDSRIVAHFSAGANPECPSGLVASAEAQGVILAWSATGSERSVQILRNGDEIAMAAPVDPPRFVDADAEPGVLEYELIFDLPAARCSSLRTRLDTCLEGLEAEINGADIDLYWSNRGSYAAIEVRREDTLIATVAGDETSYTDIDVPAGDWTYSVKPQDGECPARETQITVLSGDYARTVTGDRAVGYWRLDEEDEFALVATNSAPSGAPLNGMYSGLVQLGADGLLEGVEDNLAMVLDGLGGKVVLPDSSLINVGGPFDTRSIEIWFRADTVDLEPRFLFEEGGATRGINIFVQETDGVDLLHLTAWNLAEQQWGPVVVSAEIAEGEVHHAVLILDSTENELFGDFDGRLTGYLDGEEIESQGGVDRLFAHTDDCAIGGLGQGTLLPDRTTLNTGGSFVGAIDEVAIYNVLLDDPNDDGDRSDSRVGEHFRIGSGGGSPARPRFHRGDADNDGSVTLSDAIFTLNHLFSGGPDTTCKEAQDFENDGQVVLTDAVGLLQFLFSQGPPPAAPGPTSEPCGVDPDPAGSAGDLGCDRYTGCDAAG